uniref:Uncharacterized protein n=1 Tax=Anopheles dirus TaxID=7168 RepID=A0A182NTY0_9DIPT
MFSPHRWKASVRERFEGFFEFSKDADYFYLVEPLLKPLYLFANPLRCVKDFGLPAGVLVQLVRFLCLLPYASYVYVAYWNIEQRAKIPECIITVGTVLVFTLSIIRCWVLNVYNRELGDLRAFFNDRTYQEQDEWVHRTRARFYRRWNWIISLFLVLSVLDVVIFVATNWNKPNFNVQYRGVVVRSVPVQIASEFFSGYIGVSYMISSSIMHLVLRLFRMEFSILTRTLKLSVGEEMAGDTRQEAFRLFTGEFHANIKRHASLLQYVNTIWKKRKAFSTFRKMFRLLALLQYHGALIVMTCICLYSAYQQFSLATVSYTLFGAFLIFDTFLLCVCLDDLNDLNQDVGYIVYSLHWPATLELATRGVPKERLKSVRRTILIVMQHSQQPLRIGFGEFGTLSRHRFAEMIQHIYSLIMFLCQFK